jgi:hypothetical protein
MIIVKESKKPEGTHRMEVIVMTKIEEMKSYILKNNLAHLVRELVEGIGYTSEEAIEYVYDQHELTKEQFIKKYF